jgi:acyl-CoA thioester hydrolase
MDKGVHVFPLTVYYEDTDAAGVVYYANYLKYAERARTELLRDLGIEQSQLLAEAGLAFAVRSVAVDYLKPARLDDRLEVHSRLREVRGASIEADQRIRRGDVELVRIEVRVACVNISGRPARVPAGARAKLEEMCNMSERV